MTLTLYNTLTRTKAPFQPIDPANVRMYVCGPTVYDFAHIGNARPVIVFDVLYRLLKHLYPGPGTAADGSRVTYVRNITDVDDKINARAAERYPELAPEAGIRKLTEETAAQFHKDIAALGVLPPTFEPRATENIQQMIDIIVALLEKGHAYVAAGEVLFDVRSMKDYGELSNRNLDDQQAGARVEVEAHKKYPGDFVLWKLSEPHEPGWESPWGRGRPGWHIECSAMSARYLGEVFDIHGGGLDLIFPHHENEIAQSRCAHGTPVMAKTWMHNGFLQVEGEKMSKSLGNFVTINELLETQKFGGRKWPGDVVRLAMLMTHYRKPIDWTAQLLTEAYSVLSLWREKASSSPLGFQPSNKQYYDELKPGRKFLEALEDDLNTPATIAEMHRMARDLDSQNIQTFHEFYASGVLLGIWSFDQLARKNDLEDHGISRDEVDLMLAARKAARAAKDFKESDRIRDELAAMGIALKDTKNKETGEIETTWEVAR